MTTWQTITWAEVAPAVVRVRLNRPQKLNAYNSAMCSELRAAVDMYDRDDSLRAMVLTGTGRAFCVGGDVSGGDENLETELAGQMGRAQNLKHDLHAVLRAILGLDKVVIAAINGHAVAGGLSLALAADVRLASSSARVGDTSGQVGLLPDEGGAWLFPRAMGYESAFRMVALSELYDAEQALRMGLVSEVVEDVDLESRAVALATEFAGRSPVALRVTKRLMRDALSSSFDQALSAASLAVMFVNTGPDAQEGLAAFRERRRPDFPGTA